MKVLIAVMSCQRDALNGCHQAIRETWVTRMVTGLDYKIFMGRGDHPLTDDEVRLDVPDDYYSLHYKSQAIRRWALEQGYDFVFKADRDTYLSPRRLLASGFEQHDYVGHFPSYPEAGPAPKHIDERGCYPYASGGCGYWTSARAMRIIVDAPVDHRALDNRGLPAEDLWIPNILFPAGLDGYHDPRYLFRGDRLYTPYDITVHLSVGTDLYHPECMRNAHRWSQ